MTQGGYNTREFGVVRREADGGKSKLVVYRKYATAGTTMARGMEK